MVYLFPKSQTIIQCWRAKTCTDKNPGTVKYCQNGKQERKRILRSGVTSQHDLSTLSEQLQEKLYQKDFCYSYRHEPAHFSDDCTSIK